MMTKERLDVLLVNQKMVETREKAKRLIMAGLVFTGTERLDKPGMKIDVSTQLSVKGKIPYVSRGGFKLEKALESFSTSVTNKIIVDIGASTGGFSDCALQNGAKSIYAIDVGYNQLAWKLRNDERIIVKERTNFRHVTKDVFTNGLPNYAMIDVSFISLTIILPVLKQVLQENSEIVTLIKPQFEANRHQVGKKGVVRDKQTHEEVLHKIVVFAENEGYEILQLTHSPITGGEGNIEFLAHFSWAKENEDRTYNVDNISNIVEQAHQEFKKAK